MGRKILTDAGYEVVAVSNGAAAVKKIAEQKPDIIILDVYMPGYSGLEVCEKVRGSIETLKTPVLLTVGKMEPYKPEEANRVRADGVIVKPFEASDLLAIVKKFEERIGQASVPTLVQPILVERFHETPVPPMPHAEELPVEQPEPAMLGSVPQATVEVPDHMATTSAFSDLLNTDTARAMDDFKTPATPIAARPSSIQAPLPDYDIPVSWRREALPEPTVITAPATASTPEPPPKPEPVASAATPVLPLPIRPRPIPVYQEPKERSPLELVPTSAPPTGDIEIAPEPELQESAAETTRNTVAEAVEPGLLPTLHHEEEPLHDVVAREAAELAPLDAEAVFSRLQEVAPAESAVAEPADGARTSFAPERVRDPEPVERKTAESDFEARVAAAMAAYNSATAIHEDSSDFTRHAQAAGVPVIEKPPAAGRSLSESLEAAPVRLAPEADPIDLSTPVQRVASVAEPSLKVQVSEEPARAVELASVAAPVALQPDSGIAAVPAAESLVETVAHRGAVSASVEAVLPEAVAAAGAATGADHETIAQAVHKVMERLKPELVEEIVRELKAKK
jgi:CheY-like chemotaxis protein